MKTQSAKTSQTINHIIKNKKMLQGIKSKFYTDIKTPVMAGMQFSYNKGETKNNKLQKIGYDLVRIYFDTIEKDCTIGQERIKRVFNN